MASTLKINNLDTASGSTITIPTGKQLIGTDTNSIKAPGMVVQIATDNDTTSLTMGSNQNYFDTGLSIAFTPKYSNSIIVIQCMMGAEVTGNSNMGIGFKVFRDSTEIYNNDYALYNSSNNAQRIEQVPILIRETSSSTSARTYKVQASRRAGGGTAYVNRYAESYMIITEYAQ